MFVHEHLTALHVLFLSAWEICRASNLCSYLVPPVISHHEKHSAKDFPFSYLHGYSKKLWMSSTGLHICCLDFMKVVGFLFHFLEDKRYLIPSKLLGILPKFMIIRKFIVIPLSFNIFSSNKSTLEGLRNSSLFPCLHLWPCML